MSQPNLLQQHRALSERVVQHKTDEHKLNVLLPSARRRYRLLLLRMYYLRLKTALRAPAKDSNTWIPGIIAVGPLVAGTFAFGCVHLCGLSIGASLAVLVAVAGAAAPFIAREMFVPNNDQLKAKLVQQHQDIAAVRRGIHTLTEQLHQVQGSLLNDQQALDRITNSVAFHREALLSRNWRAMRGEEWEQFLANVFQLLGATVQTTSRSGDQGIDLIANFGNRRYAIQAKGYFNAVGNSAVQEAVAGMNHYGCTHSAVITNSRFTKSAIVLATSNRCLLIGEDDIPAFVLGKLPL